jgi:hypothetical protein
MRLGYYNEENTMTTGFEKAKLSTLIALRENLLSGLDIVAEHISTKTFEISPKEGAAPPSQAGTLTLNLLLVIEDELEARVVGYERVVDPKFRTS